MMTLSSKVLFARVDEEKKLAEFEAERQKMIAADMLKKKMECRPMIMMLQMTQFVQKNIILKKAREHHDTEIQVDIAFGRAFFAKKVADYE